MVDIKVDSKEVEAMLGDLRHKLPSAIARGLTETAKDAQKFGKQMMELLFDRPTRYTLGSLDIIGATKEDQRAAVVFKRDRDRLSRSDIDGEVKPSSSMIAQVFGGRRRMKASEELLARNGLISSSQQLIPAIGAKRDAFGNVPGSFMNKVLFSGVKGGSVQTGKTTPLNGRQQRSSTRGQYFIKHRRFGIWGPIGIYQNMGKRKDPLPVFLIKFASQVKYKVKYPFDHIISASVEKNLKRRVEESVDVIIKKYSP